MRYFVSLAFTVLFLFVLVVAVNSALARPKHLFKVASLAPDGSVWVQKFKQFSDEVKAKTKGEVGFRVYPGGIMGDDMAMYRKMRVGQLHGGGFTMTGISNVVPDFRIMSIPFLFQSYDEVDAVNSGLLPLFKQRFDDQGMTLIAMTEVGFIYTMSVNPVATMDELQQTKSWIPAGDPIATAFLSNIGITPIQLSIPDVLSSLQTGLIDTVFNSLYGSIVLQWFTKARYVTDIPFGYAYGAFLLDKKKFSRLSREQQDIIHAVAQRHFSVLMEATRTSNEESRGVLEKHGVEFVAAEEGAVVQLRKHRDKAVAELSEQAFSSEVYDTAMGALTQFRTNNK